MPNDEALEYLPTQAIADFLATEVTLKVDGIIFPSVQFGAGLNVVLFHKAARVANMEIPAGAKISVQIGTSTEDDGEPDYSVVEQIPRMKQDAPAEQERLADLFALTIEMDAVGSPASDFRPATLEVEVSSVQVHRVKKVSFETDVHKVQRYRWEKRGHDF
jgi:hypothetical protein